MGNCCCFGAELPCGSMEERSGLLKDNSKTSGAGACGPENGEDTSVEETKEEPLTCQNRHREPDTTQGNGHLQNENIQEANTSPSKDSTAGAQREEQKDAAADQRTLNQTQENISAPDAQEALAAATAEELKTEKQSLTAGQENFSDPVSPEPKSALPENLSPPETNTPSEDNTASGSHAGSGGDAAKPLEKSTQNNEVLSEPSAQEASISAVSQETNTDAPRCSVECNVDPVNPKDHVIAQPPASGSEPAGVGPTQENLDSVGSDTTPEAASAAEAMDSLKSSQEENRDPESLSPPEETRENVTEEEKKNEEKKQDKVEDGLIQTEDLQVEKQPAIQEQLGTSDVDIEPNAEAEDGLDDRSLIHK